MAETPTEAAGRENCLHVLHIGVLREDGLADSGTAPASGGERVTPFHGEKAPVRYGGFATRVGKFDVVPIAHNLSGRWRARQRIRMDGPLGKVGQSVVIWI